MFSPSFSRPLRALLLVLACGAWQAQAHDGHDAGTPEPAVQSTPRFSASSELFELVGQIDGQQLTLYLDHAADNRPVTDAELTLDWGGQPLALHSAGAGLFTAQLPAPLASGETAFSASVVAGADSDLLAGELDWHPASSAAADGGAGSATNPIQGAWVGWSAAAALGLLLGWAWGRRGRHGRRNAARQGEAV